MSKNLLQKYLRSKDKFNIEDRLRVNKKCVYTVIVGDYCNLNNPTYIQKDWDFYCFTNNKDLKSQIWKIIYIEEEYIDEISQIKLARKYKTQGFKYLRDYDVYLYVDGRVKINRDLNMYLKYLKSYEIKFMSHRQKNALEHMDMIENLKYESPEIINLIKSRYKEHNYNYDNGLIESGILLFKKTPKVIEFFDNWWGEIQNYSHRDQLSANFSLFLTSDLNYTIGDNPLEKGILFKLLPRTKERFILK